MYNQEFEDIDELLSYLESLNIYCVMRDGLYINFPSMGLKEFFSKDKITGEYYCKGEYKKREFEPSLDDIQYLRAFKFINLTFRGTIEYRSVCTQPIKDSMSVAAFHVGLKHKTDELNELFLKSGIYKNDCDANELRKLLIRREIPDFVDMEKIYGLALKVLDLAKEGLLERDLGEEVFLDSLYDNLNNRTNPGKRLLDSLDGGKSLEEIIKEYGEVE
ncbi:gamma-glutamylcysteine synthetase GshA2 [Methanobrevibacter ruminantium M1]|uniref:Gamma-glutamylcysteine synthetase GshA2 n=2 Tax=Methanobrevibacter ruminantium TaxID=83816 RepID=D3E132_METRM|nr:gamma-glutamylcysteine synthetase GshA2 [Methanobrevibacter ruminantium M1]